MDLTDAHVLVTGASRGIGAGLARAFAGAGARVTPSARPSEDLDALAAELGTAAVAADLADPAGRRGLVARAEQAGGPVDVLVNNAGLDLTGPFTGMDEAALEHLLALNLLAPMELARQAVPGMVERGLGHVVNVSSLAGIAALPGMVGYATTKAALSHFTSGLRADLRGLPVGTTLLETGLVPTAMRTSVVGNPPTDAAFRRLYRLGLLTDTSVERLGAAAVRAVRRDRRHVRLPRRAWLLPALAEAPRRIVELTITGVPPR